MAWMEEVSESGDNIRQIRRLSPRCTVSVDTDAHCKGLFTEVPTLAKTAEELPQRTERNSRLIWIDCYILRLICASMRATRL